MDAQFEQKEGDMTITIAGGEILAAALLFGMGTSIGWTLGLYAAEGLTQWLEERYGH